MVSRQKATAFTALPAVALGEDGKGRNGLQGYLQFVGRHHPKAFYNLLGKLLPMQRNADGLGASIGTVNVVSVPAGAYLSNEDIERLSRPGHVIEHAPQPAAAPSIEPTTPAPEDDLESLSYDELLRRAGEAGLIRVD